MSAIKMSKYLERKCFMFLAHVVEKHSKVERIQDILVVKDHLEDFPGPSSPRKVEFQMDLIPRATLVAKAPYRLALSEMQEPLGKLKELLSDGLIRPCLSPWRDPVLFIKKKDGSL
nr:putative reverse transcriptase domain-containing protein [Tanacetum cinerariifolium]